MSSRASSWTLMEDFFVQECCVHGTDLENHGPTSILCDDPLPIESTTQQCYNEHILHHHGGHLIIRLGREQGNGLMAN